MEQEQLNSVLKKLEGVYKCTIDLKQKKRVKTEISKIKKQIRELTQFGSAEVLQTNDVHDQMEVKKVGTKETKSDREYKILSVFPVEPVHKNSTNHEVNAVITYVNIFETELWGALSDFHLKLDYFHSRERDKFYNTFENVKRFINEYIHILDEFDDSLGDDYLAKLKLMKNKHSRALMIDAVKFITGIQDFIQKLIDDYNANGNIVLNADELIRFSKIEGNKLLNKWVIIDALKYIRDFCDEFLYAINLPDEMVNIE